MSIYEYDEEKHMRQTRAEGFCYDNIFSGVRCVTVPV